MICPFCSYDHDLPMHKDHIAEHLVITKTYDSHYHVHGPLNNQKEILTMIHLLCEHAEIKLIVKEQEGVEKVELQSKQKPSKEQKRLNKKYDTSVARSYRTRSA